MKFVSTYAAGLRYMLSDQRLKRLALRALWVETFGVDESDQGGK